jgi:hypothetical protein
MSLDDSMESRPNSVLRSVSLFPSLNNRGLDILMVFHIEFAYAG